MATRTAGAGSTTWTSAAFSGGAATVAADEVIVPTGSTLTISAANTVVCRSISVTGTGTLVFAATTSVVNMGDATAGTGNVALSVASGATITLTGIGTINFISTSATQQTVTSGGKTLPNMNFNGAGSSYIFGDAITSSGTITHSAGTLNSGNYTIVAPIFNYGNATTRTLTLGSSALTLTNASGPFTGSGVTNHTMTANTAIATLTGAVVSNNNIFVLADKDWNGLSIVITGGGQAAFNLGGTNARLNNLTITGTASQINSYRLSHNMTITGTFTVNGNSAINRPLIFGVTTGTANSFSAATTSLTNVDFMDITGTGAAAWTGTTIGDWGGNTGITFTTPATQTRDSTAAAWGVAVRWTSRVPLPQDSVVVNASSGNITSTDVLVLGKSLDFTGYTGTITHTSSGNDYNLFGDMTLSSGMSFGASVNTFNFNFRGRGTHTITTNGKVPFPYNSNGITTILAPGGTYTLADTYSQPPGLAVGNYTFQVSAGSFSSANQTMNVGRISSIGTLTRSITLGTSTVNLMATAATTLLGFNTTGLTLSATDATFNIVNTSTNTRTIDLGGNWIGTLNYTVAGSTGQLNITTAAIISTLNFSDATNARTLQITTGITLTCFSFIVFGGSGRLVTVQSSTTTVAFLSSPLQLFNSSQDYITYSYIQVNQPLSLWCNTNSTASNSPSIPASAPTYKHVQSASGYTASGTSVSSTLVLTPTAGDLLVAYFASANSQGSFTPPVGWTQAVNNSVSALAYIYFKISDGTESTVTFSQTTARTLYTEVVQFSGFTGTPTLDVTDNNGSAGASTSLSTTSTTGPTNTDQPALAIAMWANPSTLAATVSLTNSFIEDRSLTNTASNFKGAVRELTTTAAVSTTLTWTTSRAGTAAVLAVFKNVASASNGNFFLFF